MDWEQPLTVQEAIARPVFADAQVTAGSAGLDRPVRWVHVLEISSFEKLLYGEEMILATGVGFHPDPDRSVTFMEKLIDQGASCLCVELGPYFPSVPDSWIRLAEEHRFPLILFHRTVRFVDITQDLHTLILSRHHNTLRELEVVSREFHRLTLTSQGTGNVLKLLHRSTRTRLVYLPLPGSPTFHPAPPPGDQEKLLQFLADCRQELDESKPNAAPYIRPFQDKTAIVKPIGAQSQTWAYLAMICERQPRETDYLLLDSASLSIAQELLRTRYMEERKLFAENRWVEELLNGQLEDDKQLLALAGPHLGRIQDLHLRVCLIEIGQSPDADQPSQEHERESIRYHLSLHLRSVFEKHGYRPFITVRNERLTVIAVDQKSRIKAKDRFRRILDALTAETSDQKPLQGYRLTVGCGNACTHLRDAPVSYREAMQALSMQEIMGTPAVLYEELGIYRLLLQLGGGSTLDPFIQDCLGPLLEHDRTKGSELLATLKVYLDHDGSKQIAAQKLFIVRQSLYYRLEKIKELLGVDVLSPEHRISIQVALRAFRLLHPDRYRECLGVAGTNGTVQPPAPGTGPSGSKGGA
ncbi:PucR family transcriptional regulator [Gorillibacterium sp. sgz5001074]|uniref:PucR family transcriptional regulator n=1 Tax=Gorillibacterium sp. sgz5001074 TaxID=3446695 RepID=UPI003F66653D